MFEKRFKTRQIGAGIFKLEQKKLKSKYAKNEIKKDPKKEDYFLVLEQEATSKITNSIHGMCRDQILINSSKDFLEIVKELNPKEYDHYFDRVNYLLHKSV